MYLAKQAGANQRRDVARMDCLDRLLPGKLIDLTCNLSANLRGATAAVEHLHHVQIRSAIGI
jgi:hypothetical protein